MGYERVCGWDVCSENGWLGALIRWNWECDSFSVIRSFLEC